MAETPLESKAFNAEDCNKAIEAEVRRIGTMFETMGIKLGVDPVSRAWDTLFKNHGVAGRTGKAPARVRRLKKRLPGGLLKRKIKH